MKKLLLLTALLFTFHSQAYLSLNESAEILPDTYYNLGVAPQTYLSNGGGYDASVFAEMHLFENTDGRVTIGGGDIDFWTQASMKWSPIPDVDNQPAFALRGALGYVRESKENFYHLQITPIVSKKSTTAAIDMLPYVGLPITYVAEDGNNFVASQVSLGSIFYPWANTQLGAEFNLNLKNSVSSASVFFMFPFESGTGYKK